MKPDIRKLSEEQVEALEFLWLMEEKRAPTPMEVEHESQAEMTPSLLESLRNEKLISWENAAMPVFTSEGRAVAGQIIRRHRLAERLLCDVLGMHVDDSEDAACEFEHVLAEGITSSICTLLGHPRFCPHNRPIPEGECCLQASEELEPIVQSCDQMDIGETARVAYLSAREHSRLLRLAALGITPGASLRLLQKWPSCIVECDETEIAIETDVARNIYVWRNPQE